MRRARGVAGKRVPALWLGLAAALALTACGGSGDDSPSPDTDQPNLIVVMTDDQTVESFAPRAMPYTWKLFHDSRSTIFEDATAAPPLCCPARAGFITGEYPHNHGVLGNLPGYADLRDKDNVLPAWLDQGGYRTALIGKYLNDYEEVGGTEAAPGWDAWHALFGDPAYFGYQLNEDGKVVDAGSTPEDYSTTRFTDLAVKEISQGAGDEPLFMWLAYNAPHVAVSSLEPCVGEMPVPPSRAAYERFADARLPRDPSFDEADRSDKPRAVAGKSAVSEEALDEMTLRWRCGLATLRAVDEGVRRLTSALEEAGELEQTVLVFVSDNGYFFGSHAITGDKRLPYAQSAHVPMAIRVGSEVAGRPPPPGLPEVVSNVDLAPTLLDYAGARPCLGSGGCRAVDGRSLRPLLDGDDGDWPTDRAVLLELDESVTYKALLSPRYLYSRLTRDRAGELPRPAIELYDRRADPYELDNLWQTDRSEARGLARRLQTRLDRLADCEGSSDERFAGSSPPARECE